MIACTVSTVPPLVVYMCPHPAAARVTLISDRHRHRDGTGTTVTSELTTLNTGTNGTVNRNRWIRGGRSSARPPWQWHPPYYAYSCSVAIQCMIHTYGLASCVCTPIPFLYCCVCCLLSVCVVSCASYTYAIRFLFLSFSASPKCTLVLYWTACVYVHLDMHSTAQNNENRRARRWELEENYTWMSRSALRYVSHLRMHMHSAAVNILDRNMKIACVYG